MTSGSQPSPIGRLLSGLGAALVLAVVHFALAVGSASDKSLTYDESMHLIGGMAVWEKADYRMNPASGKLPQAWVALPAVLGGARFEPGGEAWRTSQAFATAEKVLWEDGNDAGRLVAQGRAMIALWSALLALSVYLIARRSFGAWGGIIAMALCAFSPTMLAHGRLMTADSSSAFFLLLASVGMWRVLHEISGRSLLLAGLAVGAAANAKMTAPVIVLLAVLLVAVRLARGEPLRVRLRGERELTTRRSQLPVLAGVVAFLVACAVLAVWAVYGFRYSAFGTHEVGAQLGYRWEDLTSGSAIGSLLAGLRSWRLLPESYLFGLADAIVHASNRFSFFCGEYSETGWTAFFPVAFLIKTPIGTLALFVLGAVLGRRSWYRLTPVLALFVVGWIAVLATNLNIGHRHLLPTYPPLFIIAGGVAAGFARRLWRWVAGAAVLAVVLESLLVFPHYLSYFSPAVGGPSQGYRYLIDSSLDWGQDLPALQRWSDERRAAGDQRPVWLSYFGVHHPRFAGSTAQLIGGDLWREDLPPVWLTPGHYAISATNLQTVYGPLRGKWTAQHEVAWQQGCRRIAEYRSEDPVATWRAIEKAIGAEPAATALRTYRRLRLLRLCAFLRQREPDAYAGYSILIYTLSDADLRAALEGPLPAGS